MTLKVRIEHMQPGYDKSIEVEEVGIDVNGEIVRREYHSKSIIPPAKPGESNPSKEFYVHYGQKLILTEVPNIEPSSNTSGS